MAEETSHYSRRTPADRNLRASDGDRNAVGDLLRREHVVGRLDTDEYAERYGRCLEAKTYAQLDELLIDLPVGPEPVSQSRPAAASGTGWQGYRPWYGGRPRWRVPVIAWLALAGVLIALSGGPVLLLVVPLVFFLVIRPLMWHSRWRSGWRGPGCWGGRGGCGPGGTWL
jgi:Domain of unknown function (DUF1707)